MELEQIIKLINTVSDSSLTGFTLEEGNTKLVFDKQISTVGVAGENDMTRVQLKSESLPTVSNPSSEDKQEKSVICENEMQINSPLVGTFYHSPSPEEAPFVVIGDAVKKGQTLGIVEAMKLMNEIECECDGIVEEVLIKNEQMVEYGQPLFKIKNI